MVTQKPEALHGKERIQQLMEAFPEATWRQVVETEMNAHGVKPNETIRQLGRWALPDAPSYFERNMEPIYQSAQKTEGGYYLNAFHSYFGDGRGWDILLDSKSPYQFRYEERGRYRLYRDGEPVEEVFFTPRPQWYARKTSSGNPMPAVIAQRAEDLLKLGAMTYCEYGKDNLLCRYCNINPAESVNKQTGLTRLTAKREQDVYETMLAACQERQQRAIVLSGGVILDPSKEADMYARLTKTVRQAEKDAGYQTPMPLEVRCQAMEPEDTAKLKEAGVSKMGFNLEVWDPKLFEIICPGKAKYVGRERWMECLLKAVDVFGKWHVSSSLIQGIELAPPHGFKTEDEGAESYLEGCEWMLAHGIRAGGNMWRPAPGTIFEGMNPPRTEYFLRVQLALRKLDAQFGGNGLLG